MKELFALICVVIAVGLAFAIYYINRQEKLENALQAQIQAYNKLNERLAKIERVFYE